MIRYLEAGESHGKGLVAIVEGLPAGIPVDLELINTQLARRQGGHGRGGRMKIESGRCLCAMLLRRAEQPSLQRIVHQIHHQMLRIQ